jgi:prepilin-type N-terminal cleavage/methylation domain-containing protein
MHRKNRPRKAFSLIELLVVIAIIAILMTLLTPLIRRSIDTARLSGCISNLRQLASATAMFAADNNGQLPHPCWGTKYELPTVANGWLYSGRYGGKPFFDSWTNIWTGVLWEYIEDRKVYRCPADPQPEIKDLYFYPNDCWLLTTYGMNGSLCGFNANARVLRVSEMKPSDVIIWEQEFRWNVPGDFWDGSNSPDQGMNNRHYGKGAIGCVDGHVEVITQEEYNRLTRGAAGWDGRRNRFWNYPYTNSGGWW